MLREPLRRVGAEPRELQIGHPLRAAQLRKAFPDGGSSDAVRIAVAATQSNDFAAGVIALQAAKTTPGLTAAQLATLEEAAQSITADLARRADAGDAKAKAQLEAIERSRSQ